ncbi:hypothetical protein ACR9PT_10630 [Piscirickettsia salmonis]|uniref:hypothetical protein n=1 Tax=Piscirickettsia salmonis TaxID=1238 RepID=UPI003EBFFD96
MPKKLNLDDIDLSLVQELATQADMTNDEINIRQKKKKESPKVVINGYMNRAKCVTSSSCIKKELVSDIEALCKGNKWAAINYVLKLGLEELKKEKEVVFIEASDL